MVFRLLGFDSRRSRSLMTCLGCAVLALANTGCYARVQARPMVQSSGYMVYQAPPPPPSTYVQPAAPRTNAVWVNGYWGWSGSQWVWVDGYWVDSRPGYVYDQPTWIRQGTGWTFYQGGWRSGYSGYGPNYNSGYGSGYNSGYGYRGGYYPNNGYYPPNYNGGTYYGGSRGYRNDGYIAPRPQSRPYYPPPSNRVQVQGQGGGYGYPAPSNRVQVQGQGGGYDERRNNRVEVRQGSPSPRPNVEVRGTVQGSGRVQVR